MDFKSALRKGAELGIAFTAITTLILAGCGGGGAGGPAGTTLGAATTSTITPYKGPFAQGATVTITDASGNPVTLLTGGTVGANGVISVTYGQNVTYPLLVSVTGTYYNEVTGLPETTTVPLRGLITDAAAATNVPITIVTETAVALLLNQTGTISATNPMQAASAVAALSTAGTMLGIPATTVPSFTAGTNTTSDPNTILLSALAVIANSQTGASLAAKVAALANSLASLNPASAPSSVITSLALSNAIAAMTSGASSVAASGVTPPAAPTISTVAAGPQSFNASVAADNSIVGSWYSGDTLNASVLTFFDNGDYMQSKAATTNAGAQPGLEYSTYTFDSTTGAFVPTCPAAVDTNATDGLCNGSTATTFTLAVNGDSMSASNNHGQSFTLNRVIGSPLVGTWSPLNDSRVTLTFFANGDYVMNQSAGTDPSGQPGTEHGRYTWNPTTGAFISPCPDVDTNGQWGLSNPHAVNGNNACTGQDAAAGTVVTVNGNRMTFNGTNPVTSNTFYRVFSGSVFTTISHFTELALPNGSVPFGIASGPDGNLWYTDGTNNTIGKMTPSGVVTTYQIPTPVSHPQTIISAPDGNLWFVEGDGNKIAKITTAGVITEYANTAGGWPQDLAVGSDGNIWFTDQGVLGGGNIGVNANGAIGMVNISTGAVTKYPLLAATTQANWIALGADGAMWFTQVGVSNNTARIDTSGNITEFPNTAAGVITRGADGNLWVTTGTGAVASLTTAGVMTTYPIPTTTLTPFFIIAGPNGNLWTGEIVGTWPSWSAGGMLGQVNTNGVVTEYTLPASTSSNAAKPSIGAITIGPDGALWYADSASGKIGRFGP